MSPLFKWAQNKTRQLCLSVSQAPAFSNVFVAQQRNSSNPASHGPQCQNNRHSETLKPHFLLLPCLQRLLLLWVHATGGIARAHTKQHQADTRLSSTPTVHTYLCYMQADNPHSASPPYQPQHAQVLVISCFWEQRYQLNHGTPEFRKLFYVFVPCFHTSTHRLRTATWIKLWG